jgi:hypothetical protein
LIPAVGMPLFNSHVYTIVVYGRNMKPITGSTRPWWNARCRYVEKIHINASAARGNIKKTSRNAQGTVTPLPKSYFIVAD